MSAYEDWVKVVAAGIDTRETEYDEEAERQEWLDEARRTRADIGR
jgi:hypothetical protein